MTSAEISDSIDIVEYISQYVELDGPDMRGDYWGLSCFSGENTPSFSVNPERKVWWCFSTSQGGNLIEFVKKKNGVSTGRAVAILKQYAGITDDDELKVRSSVLNACSIAKKYKTRIQRPQKPGNILPYDYIDKFEFNIEKFRPWINEGINVDTLRRFQVRYDIMDDRIVFPVKTMDGKVMSIAGRTCNPRFKELKIPKYHYYPGIGTVNTLYGFSDLKDYIYDRNEVIVFEGAKSVMKAFQWGFENSVAIFTSHLNEYQLKHAIKYFNPNKTTILFALDKGINVKSDTNIVKLAHYCTVQYIEDTENMLQDKDSPVDQGKEVFERLYNNRKVLRI